MNQYDDDGTGESLYHFMRRIVVLGKAKVKKEVESNRSKAGEPRFSPECLTGEQFYLKRLDEEDFSYKGKKTKVNRVYACHVTKRPDQAPCAYAELGWVLRNGVEGCMICGDIFGYSVTKHNCAACGNVVCTACYDTTVVVKEINIHSEKKCCMLCSWGQEMISIKPPEVVPGFKPNLSLSSSGNGKTPPQNSNPISPVPVRNHSRVTSVTQPGPSAASSSSAKTREVHRNQSAIVDYDSLYESAGLNGVPLAPSDENTDDYDQDQQDDIYRFDDSTQRVHRISSFGPIQLITPTPNFVLKTKRPDGIKIFVNFCVHSAVPYTVAAHKSGGEKKKPEVPQGENPLRSPVGSSSKESNNTDKNTAEAKAPLYMLLGAPVEYQNDKDGGYCIIYDIVVHEDEVYVCSIDSTGEARNNLCTQGLELITLHYHEKVDMAIKILRLQSNYKGSQSKGATGPQVSPIAMPSRDAFISMVQIMTIPSDCAYIVPPTPPRVYKTKGSQGINGTASNDKNLHKIPTAAGTIMSQRPSPLSRQDNRRSSVSRGVDSERLSASSFSSPLIARKSSSRPDLTLKELLSPTDATSLYKGVKIIVKPTALDRFRHSSLESDTARHSAAKMINKFDTVLEDLRDYQYEMKDTIISPEAGFVIETQRASKLQKIFLNVCHHTRVAFISNSNNGEAGSKLLATINAGTLPNDVPFVTGSINDKHFEGDKARDEDKILVIDLIVPSCVMTLVMGDKTDDLKNKLAIQLLEGISSVLEFNDDFEIVRPGTASSHTYIGSNTATGRNFIPPVINFSNKESGNFELQVVGKFFKQGKGVKSWKERLFHITKRQLVYFDLNGQFKGEMDVEDCMLSFVEQKECAAPADTFPFKLLNPTIGGEYMFCHVAKKELRDVIVMLVQAKIRELCRVRQLINIPPTTTGWLKKQGHVMMNWKKRFFVISNGEIKYYEKNILEETDNVKEKGCVGLRGVQVKIVVQSRSAGDSQSCRFAVLNVSTGVELLQMEADSSTEKNAWFTAIKKHIKFADAYLS